MFGNLIHESYAVWYLSSLYMFFLWKTLTLKALRISKTVPPIFEFIHASGKVGPDDRSPLKLQQEKTVILPPTPVQSHFVKQCVQIACMQTSVLFAWMLSFQHILPRGWPERGGQDSPSQECRTKRTAFLVTDIYFSHKNWPSAVIRGAQKIRRFRNEST